MVSTLTLQPLVRVGQYELTRQLGAGGMGDVWLATDTRAQRPVALKFIKPQLLSDPSFRTRFLNEARTLGRLEHDRIVTLYNVLEDGGHLALVLRFIEGRSLADRIDAEGALPLDTVLACARDILPALGFAHERGTIHRDIKPQNVLVDGQGRSFLTDFGIAIADVVQRSTMTGFAIGTPHYMSPEQIQTPNDLSVERGGHRSDIYSFGVVLFEMLTGRVPFGADLGSTEIYRVQRAQCEEAPPLLRELNAGVPEAVERVVLACLAKAPDDRPQSCQALLEQLEAAARRPVGRAGAHVARAATVVEAARRPAAAEQRTPAATARPPAPRVSPPASKAASPKVAWLAAGALVIVGLVSAAIWSQNGSTPSATEEPAGQTSPPAPGPGPGPTARTGGPPESTLPAPQPSPAPIPTVVKRQDDQPHGTENPPGPLTPAAPPPAENVTGLIAEARRLGTQEDWCLAKEKIDEAARIGVLSGEDRRFQEQARIACELTTNP